MAIIQTNPITNGLSGALGNLIFRQLRGKTILSCKASAPKKQSELQRENRFKFKCATAYAKSAMLNDEKKTYYMRMAKKLKLPNAYTAAIGDYMRRGDIRAIDTRTYKGKAGDEIRIDVYKKDFPINQVKVALYHPNGRMLESDAAIQKQQNIFVYKAKENMNDDSPVTIRVMLCDHIMNMVTEEVRTYI
jgi:hypothetical protein